MGCLDCVWYLMKVSNEKSEIWKVKKLKKDLEAFTGTGMMISLIMPPGDHISRVANMLQLEFESASNIKNTITRQHVVAAITSVQSTLKLYSRVPPNGLVIYAGTTVADDGKEKKLVVDFEPFRPINAWIYLCDSKFHTNDLNQLLD